MQQIISLVLSILLMSCMPQSDKNIFEHTYEKHWDKYSIQELNDILYSDTLTIGSDLAESSTIEFYRNTIWLLISDLEDDRNNTDSLYPMKAFDEVIIRKKPIGFNKSLTNQQIERLLEIINDPASFNWNESTYEPGYQVSFLLNGKIVEELSLEKDMSEIKPNLPWPKFKKMKFGMLKSESKRELAILLTEVLK